MKGFNKLDGGISQKALKIAKKRNSYVPILNQVNRNIQNPSPLHNEEFSKIFKEHTQNMHSNPAVMLNQRNTRNNTNSVRTVAREKYFQ